MNILFLCTANIQRSKTAEELFSAIDNSNEYRSAGLSLKYVEKAGSTICTEEMLQWADKVCVFEREHIKRIQQHTGDVFISKIENLDIADEYSYFQRELVLTLLEKCKF
ncbi:hypothetical protein CJF42_12420 [Pseudoalteromonas sp. NBT06-2]|uniref:phosphotyrosine protein phosphatase n=1 Tax=Pseudoalteromonas sp. NBT06-2 TaxID=2025950 RepID=UPI000BA681CE|nr:phosphotyrosine protein phosphatase [Pseudoalteromonas sp. NBT06-2]PAJ74111.1 hypothetical protein CJF42_12420 [Pseudoalteromonas sp. NBT06-2]